MIKKVNKRFLSMALAFCLLAGSLNIALPVTTKADAGDPLPKLFQQAHIGIANADDKVGTVSYNKTNGSFTLNGAGAKIGKDANATADSLYVTAIKAKGNVTMTAKISGYKSTSTGMLGVSLRNSIEEDSTFSNYIGAYIDYVSATGGPEIRYARRGATAGASAFDTTNFSVKTTTEFYIKLAQTAAGVEYYIANNADFLNDATGNKMKKATQSGFSVGPTMYACFFATAGNTMTVSDIKITSEYDQNGAPMKKLVFDSRLGEVNLQEVDPDSKLAVTSNGEKMHVEQTGGSLPVTAAPNGTTPSYLVFPAVDQNLNYTLKYDTNVTSAVTASNNYGLLGGFFKAATNPGDGLIALAFRGSANNIVYLMTKYAATGLQFGSSALSGTAVWKPADTYTVNVSYPDANGYLFAITDGVPGGVNANKTMKIGTTSGQNINAGDQIRYGFEIVGMTADISNILYTDPSGYILYDQNDYYIARGIPSVVTSITAAAPNATRTAISLAWEGTQGSSSSKYAIEMSSDGGATYAKALYTDKNTYDYPIVATGTYQFKIYAVAGDESSVADAKVSAAVYLQAPLPQTVVTATGTDRKIALAWTPVTDATSYEVFRSTTATGSFTSLKSGNILAYDDTSVTNEQPYYYYVIAKSADNTSNPSALAPSLATAGHVGPYEIGATAAVIALTEKSNDTLLTDSAMLKGSVDRAGTLTLNVNGTTASSQTIAAANGTFNFSFKLKAGRNDVNLYFVDADGKKTRQTFNFVYLTACDKIVDATYTGTGTPAIPTYTTVGAAVASVPSSNTAPVVIFIKNGNYNERVVVESPYISLIGEDSVKTRIYSSQIDGGTAGRNVLRVQATATNFTVENLTVENSYAYTGATAQADALSIVADKAICVNVRLLSFQDTLFVDANNGRQYFYKCSIQGIVDFIYGRSTTYFEDCDIIARYNAGKKDGCMTAAQTDITIPYGFVFNNCRFTAESGVTENKCRLARTYGKDASTIFLNCYLGSHLQTTQTVGSATAPMTFYESMNGDYKLARFYEYYSYGPAFAVMTDRPLLSQAQAAEITVANVFKSAPGAFDAINLMNGMYLPLVASVAVSPATTSVAKGATQMFTANVTNAANTNVIWTVTGGVTGTTITSGGALTVASSETATSLTVKAALVSDPTIFGTATVTVTAPSTSALLISPSTVTLGRGTTQTFQVTNRGGQMVWRIQGAVTSGTALVVSGTTTSAALTIAANETATSFKIMVALASDANTSGSALVTVSTPAPTTSPTPITTATPTATSTPVATATPKATATPVATSTPTATSTPAATATPVPGGGGSGGGGGGGGGVNIGKPLTPDTSKTAATDAKPGSTTAKTPVSLILANAVVAVDPVTNADTGKVVYSVSVTPSDTTSSSVKESRFAKAEVAIPYTPTAEQKDVEKIVVFKVNENGDKEIVPTANFNPTTGEITFKAGVGKGTYEVGYVDKSFKDTKNYAWAEKQVEALAAKGIINGIGNDLFAPTAPVKRGDFILMVTKALGLEGKATTNFSDVPKDSYYANAVGIAKELGISSGDGKGSFNPEAQISRQDMMVLVANALSAAGSLKPANATALSQFTDKAAIKPYAVNSVAALVSAGIVNGKGNTMDPAGTTTRAETAVLVYNLFHICN